MTLVERAKKIVQAVRDADAEEGAQHLDCRDVDGVPTCWVCVMDALIAAPAPPESAPAPIQHKSGCRAHAVDTSVPFLRFYPCSMGCEASAPVTVRGRVDGRYAVRGKHSILLAVPDCDAFEDGQSVDVRPVGKVTT